MAKKHKGVRDVPSRPAKQTLTLITQKCASYYKEGLSDFERRQLIQDIWRYANFALMRLKRKAGRGRKRTTDKRIKTVRPPEDEPTHETGFRCLAAVFNMSECKVQCERCKS